MLREIEVPECVLLIDIRCQGIEVLFDKVTFQWRSEGSKRMSPADNPVKVCSKQRWYSNTKGKK